MSRAASHWREISANAFEAMSPKYRADTQEVKIMVLEGASISRLISPTRNLTVARVLHELPGPAKQPAEFNEESIKSVSHSEMAR